MPYQEPEFLPWDGRRVPLTFVAGYLGAGKTTLINELLARTDRPIAVFVNDVGQVNLDARLIRRRHGDTIELTDGCVCCSLSGGFGEAFDRLRARPEPPDHLVVELSGVADPARVLPWGHTAGFRLDGIVTVVDAQRLEGQLADPLIGPAVEAQARSADLVVLTKLSAGDEPVVRRRLDGVLGSASDRVPVVVSGDGAWSAAGLIQIGGRRPGGVAEVPPVTLFDRHAVEHRTLRRPIDRRTLEAVLDDLGPAVVRAKGIAVDPRGRRWLIQVVGARRSITELPEAEDEAPTDLVVISLR
jgi:G3E family GTPase